MNWLNRLAEMIARYVLRRAKADPNVTAREYEQWKRDYQRDFGREFK